MMACYALASWSFVAVAIALVAGSMIWQPVIFWNAFGFSRLYFSDAANLVLIFAGLFYAMMPGRAAESERRNRHKIWGILFVVVGLAGFVFGLRDKAESNQHINELMAGIKSGATVQDVSDLRTDLLNLRQETKSGFDSVVAAIKALQSSTKQSPAEAHKPLISGEPTPPKDQVNLGPALVQHLQVSQRRTESSRADVPYAIQVILQTDIPTQPTAFMIECNGEIEDGKFFVTGQAVMMGIAYGIQPDKKRFYFRFAYPAFTPDSPIVVTLTSKTDIRVISVSKAN